VSALRLHDLPPYLRAALMPAIRGDREQAIDEELSVGLAEARGDVPVYLCVWDRELELATRPDSGPGELVESLEAFLAAGGLREHVGDVFALVGLLSIWDDLIRELELYHGRVYLASEDAVRRLYPLAGTDQPSENAFHTLLLEAQALELMYRFPVAFKFRRAYGHENQCRLNGWGRRLARRAFADPESARVGGEWRDRLRAHLLENRDAYRAHVEYVASDGLRTAPADSWERAKELPVPLVL
jgi:hypothetical protein